MTNLLTVILYVIRGSLVFEGVHGSFLGSTPCGDTDECHSSSETRTRMSRPKPTPFSV
jgi:hypothetical protein